MTVSEIRMKTTCANCPFSGSKAGIQLRDNLERFDSIKSDLLKGRHFICHKTIHRPRKKQLLCAGAIQFQADHGIKSDLLQVMERLEMRGFFKDSK